MADYNHRAAIALALRPISPALAALHAVHLKRTTAELLTPLTCAHCGHAPVQIRSRKAKSKTNRVVERSCEVCTFVDAVPVKNTATAQFKSTRITRRKHALGNRGGDVPVLTSQSATAVSPSPPTPTSIPKVTHAPPPSTTNPPSSTSKRLKRKPGLQELLARNRERQAQQQQQQRGTGLTSFLDGL